MEDIVYIVIISLIISIILFFVLREVICWYWKVNERITLHQKTNFLLEKILIQLGATGLDEIIIEDVETGKRKTIKIDKWIEFKMKNPTSSKYKPVKGGQ